MVHAPPREGFTVLDGLHYWDGQPSVTKRFHPGPPDQLRPFHYYGVPPWRRPIGAHQIPGSMPAVTLIPPKTAYSVRLVVHRPAAGYSQTAPQ